MKIKGFTNNQLKIIAMISMLIDHIGFILFPQIKLFRIIGRISFPIFAYMIAEGCTYTRNKLKYLLSLGLLVLICQISYFIGTSSMYMNVLITFTLSVICIFSIDLFTKNKTFLSGFVLLSVITVVFFICVIISSKIYFYDFKVDYGLLGVLLPVGIYVAHNKTEKIIYTAILLLMMSATFNDTQFYSLMSIPLLLLYNGKRGKFNIKYLFYFFYPIHLGVLYAIDLLL